MVRIGFSFILWIVITFVMIILAMASITNEGMMKYAYFFSAFVCSYIIRLTSRMGDKNESKK